MRMHLFGVTALSKSWRGKLVSSLRRRGFAGTIRAAAALVKRSVTNRWRLCCLSNPWYSYLEKRFDRRFAVDTGGFLDLPERQSDPRFKHAFTYEPTPRSVFFRMLRRIDVDYSSFVFIDFG